MTKLRFSTRTLLLASALALPAAAAHAEQAPATAPAAEPGPGEATTGEIIVTSRYRNETLQQVPIAITAVSGASLNDRQLHTLQDLSKTVPSVDFRNGASNKDRTVFIRGIGTISTSPGVESSVSTVLDGVVLTRPGMATLDVGEVERIEVLRGPQGTLFGKNASAGVVNIVTAAPSEQFHAYAEGTVTTDQEYRLKAGVTGKVAENVSARIDGLYANYRGNVRNENTGDHVNGYERYGARAKIEAHPTENLKLTLGGDYVYAHDTTPNGVSASTSQTAYPTGVVTNNAALASQLAAEGVTAGSNNRRVSTDFNSNARDKNYGTSLTGELSLAGGYTVTSITAYRWWKNHQHQDYDGLSDVTTAFAGYQDYGSVNSRQFSQELRLASPKGHFIDYVVGAYYLHAKQDEVYERDLNSLTLGDIAGVADYGTTSNSYALFGEANINFTSWLRAIAGYRSTWDKLGYYHVRTSTNDPDDTGASATDVSGIRGYHNTSGSTTAHGNSYRLGLQADANKTNQVYFTYTHGYKGPAYDVYFNMRSLNATTPLDEIALKPETSNSFEGGIKGSALNHQITYALALFDTKFHNYQANFSDIVDGAQVTRLINAGTVQTKGVELDFGLHPIPGLSLNTSVTYDDAKIVNFQCPAGAAASCDVNGGRLPFAPKWKLYTNAAYRFALSDRMDLEVQSDIALKSATQYQLTQTANTIQPSYYIWNASIALLQTQDHWQVRAFVKNITNQHYSDYLVNGNLAGTWRYVPRDDERYAGVMLRTDF